MVKSFVGNIILCVKESCLWGVVKSNYCFVFTTIQFVLQMDLYHNDAESLMLHKIRQVSEKLTVKLRVTLDFSPLTSLWERSIQACDITMAGSTHSYATWTCFTVNEHESIQLNMFTINRKWLFGLGNNLVLYENILIRNWI